MRLIHQNLNTSKFKILKLNTLIGMWKLAHESLGGQMRSIWTGLLSVIVLIGRLAQHATKAALIFLISVAMWLPMCLTANTAVAADSGTAANAAISGNSGKKHESNKSGDKPKSAAKPNADVDADNADISAPSQPPVFVDGQNNAFAKLKNGVSVNNNLANNAAKGDASDKGLIDSAMMSAAKGMAKQGASYTSFGMDRSNEIFNNTERSSNGDKMGYDRSRMEFRPGCNRNYARSECITDDGDETGHRASKGADMERGDNPWREDSGYDQPQGIYTNNDPNFTPYPRGTYLQKRIRNLAYLKNKNGVDSLNRIQLDDVHDYIFMKRTPKRDGNGYIWDVLVNMGARIHGAAKALTYFVVPKDQSLDTSNGQYDQYVERLHFDAKNRGCAKDWVNPNGFCIDEGTRKEPLNDGETLDKAWYRIGNSNAIDNVGVFEGGTQRDRDDSNRKLGLCDSYGFDCYHSGNYGFPSEGEHKAGTRLPPDGTQKFNDTYIKLIDNLFSELRGTDKEPRAKIFALRNQFDESKSPYSYHIHYTTSNNGKYGKLSTSYYGAGSYYGDTWHGPLSRYGLGDPYNRNPKYSLSNYRIGSGHTTYEYTTLYQQWYGIPNLVDINVPHYSFLRGTHLGPFTSNNGQLLAHTKNIDVTSLLFQPTRQEVCDKDTEAQCGNNTVWAKGQLSLLPKYNASENKYARGNRWWRKPLDPKTNINTKDSKFGIHDLTVQYWNDKLQMGSAKKVKYDIIGQADVFRPLQTQEWQDNPKYRSSKESLGKAADYVNYQDNKGKIYEFAHALNPRLYMPDAHTKKNLDNYDNYSDAEDSVYYGSIKDGKIPSDAHGLEYPLNDSYLYSQDSGANAAIKNRAIYSVEWTNADGSLKKSNTLKDAETKVAVRVPVVNVVDPCKGDDDKAADKAADKSAQADAAAKNKDSQECKLSPLNYTKRYIWKLYDAPSGKTVDQKLTGDEKAKYAKLAKDYFSNPVKEEYATPTNPNDENRIMLQFGEQPEVKPVYVAAKYAKITYWDESTGVLPLVFTHVDDEKPTIDVKVSINGGEPRSVPENGMKISVGSRIRFLVTGHDDKHVYMGTKEKVKDNNNKTDIQSTSEQFKATAFNKYDQSKPVGVDSATDQSGYVTTSETNGPELKSNDSGVKEFTFHAWDDAGNKVQKKIKLIITGDEFTAPNVRWQKQPNGRYVGKVNLLTKSKQVAVLAVRIWKRGEPKQKPVGETDTFRIFSDCPNKSCHGIMLTRQAGEDWQQLNDDKPDHSYFTNFMPYEKDITFDPKTGEITIPEHLAEIGSRIYAGVGNNASQLQTTLNASSDPLPLDMTWPDDGMVQVNPYELNPSEKQGLIDRIKQKNPRLFQYRKDEIGWSKDETKTLGGTSDKYSCKDNTKQYKICLSVTPDTKNTAQGKSGSEKTFKVVKATGTGNDTKDDLNQETVLDPKQKKITRFVNIRADYDWSYGSGKINGRNTDDGFKWYGRDENSSQYLVYRFNINQGDNKNFNTNEALSLFQGTKKSRWLRNQIQPSLYPLNTNAADSTNKTTIEKLWGGYNRMPNRGDGIGYARKVNNARGEWANIVDLVNYSNLGGGQTIFTNNITDKDNFVQPQGYVMPGGEDYNQQDSGANIGAAILKKSGNKYPLHAQLYIFNGNPWRELEARDEGDKDHTPNVINVWFVPVDKNKPWISVKDANDPSKKLLGECNPTKTNANSCGTVTTIDMNKTDITKQSGLFNVVDLLALDDDFNVADKTTHVSKALKDTLSIDIEAEGATDPKTKKAPRVRFVTGGNTNKELLRGFIEKWRGNDSKNSPTFKMIAQVTDDSGNKSDEAVVGKFKFNWTVAKAPVVRAYDGNHYNDLSGSGVWLHDWEGASAPNYSNKVSVISGNNATRLVVYFARAKKAAAKTGNTVSLRNAGANAIYSRSADATTGINDDSDISESLALCRAKTGDRWSLCDGYTFPEGLSTNDLNQTAFGGDKTAILFPSGFLAPGSVVRARNRTGSYGPWSDMPGVKSENLDELANDANETTSVNNDLKKLSGSENLSQAQNGANSAKEEDMRGVQSVDSLSSKRSSVCRPESKAPKVWSEPSDCVFFPVVVNKKVVQVHPLLLNDSEKRAVNHVLRNGNAGGKWLDSGDNDSLDNATNTRSGVSVDNSNASLDDDDDTLAANESKVTWKRGNYIAPQKQDDGRNNYSNVGSEQDSFILMRGWRRRTVTPEPRRNIVTRFAKLRSDSNSAADYTITWDKKKPYIGERSSDPGFELVGAPGHQSLVYRYNASTKDKRIDLNQLQNALTLKPNVPSGMSEDEFKKIQPSLRVVSGTDKKNGEGSKEVTVQLADGKTRVDKFGNGSGFFTLNDEYINIPDLVLGNGNYGGGLNVSNTNGMNYSTLGNNYLNMSPQDITVNKWCEGGDTANPNCTSVNSESFNLEKVLGGHKNIETADDIKGTSKKAIAPVYALSLSNGWAMNSLKNTYGYNAQTHFKNVASAPTLLPVYVVPVDVIKPKAESIGSLQKSTMSKPYEVSANDIKFTFTGNPDTNGKVGGKELLVDASDDFDSRDVVEKNLQVCVRWMNNNKPQDKNCTPILKRDNSGNASVDSDKLQQMLVTHGNTAVYAVYAQTKDKSDNKSVGYDESKETAPIIGYIKITGINVSPIPLPFTGGNAAITYTFLFGILMALFIASGAFGRRGWLASVLSGNGFSGELTYSKHCNVSAEPLRCRRLFGLIYKNRH